MAMTSAPSSGAILRALVIALVLPALAMIAAGTAIHQSALAEQEAATAQTALAAIVARRNATTQGDAKQLLLTGETAGVAGAALQSLLSDIADMSGVDVQRLDPGTAEPTGALTRVTLAASLTGSEADMMDFVVNLEATEPLVFIDRLQLIAQDEAGEAMQALVQLSAYAARFAP
jgi:hypothetical protein